MEKIRVNMTPCEEVKTIHASQDDNATRKWAFDLYDEDGKIDSSDIKEQMIFDSRVGGTEQILPVNGSNPTTSPIIADIQYPDSLRSEQTFLYRESPTTVNGQTKIANIKGNTLVWNQLVPISATATRTVNNVIYTNNNDGSFTINGLASANADYAFQSGMNYVANHKYYLKGGFSSSVSLRINAPSNWENGLNIDSANGTIIKCITSYSGNMFYRTLSGTNADVSKVYPMLFDLTSMGIDNLTTASEVEAWLSSHIGNLPYYGYTLGKLLPFLGTELKTTGKNLFELFAENKRINDDGSIGNSSNQNLCRVEVIPNTTYTFSFVHEVAGNITINYAFYDGNDNLISKSSYTYGPQSIKHSYTFTTVSGTKYFYSSYRKTSSEQQVEIGSTATEYEPYTSSTINLPVLEHFATGMKSVPNGSATQIVRDELLENKAIPRVGVADMGELNWQRNATYNVMYAYITDKAIGRLNIVTDTGYKVVDKGYTTMSSGEIAGTTLDNGINCKDDNYTSASAFQTAMSGKYLYYELATPTEESITTASLVTEKGEAPLYYDDELIADCNETISSESGIFDAKIKLMDDETVYSQKIRLHVERKP